MKNLFLIFFIFLAKTLLAQDSILVKERIVIASILKMRAAPNLKSKVIAKLPFNTQVEVLNVLNNEQAEGFELDKEGLVSFWTKIKFQNKIGFVPLCYLNQPIEFGQYGVYPSLKVPHWYKIKKSKNGDFLKKIEVKMDFYPKDEVSDGIRDHVVEIGKVDENEDPMLIASFQNFREGKIGDFYSDCFDNEDNQENCPSTWREKDFKNDARFQNCSIELKNDSLYFVNGKKKQFLFPRPYCNAYLSWYGDFDMDNKPDFILETSSNMFFFLSSKAEKGDMVKLVSHFTFCECD